MKLALLLTDLICRLPHSSYNRGDTTSFGSLPSFEAESD